MVLSDEPVGVFIMVSLSLMGTTVLGNCINRLISEYTLKAKILGKIDLR